jgi:hypothetical protein
VPHNPALLAQNAPIGTGGVAQTLLSVLVRLGTIEKMESRLIYATALLIVAADDGSDTVIDVPAPSCERTSMRPPCSWTMR